MPEFAPWHIAIMVVVAVILLALAVILPPTATGDLLLALPDTFNLKSIATSTGGTAYGVGYVGRYDRVADMDAIGLSKALRAEMLAVWVLTGQSETNLPRYTFLRRMGDSLLDPQLTLSVIKYNSASNLLTMNARSAPGSASTIFRAIDPLTFDGAWALNKSVRFLDFEP
jgi:hypothetical protein